MKGKEGGSGLSFAVFAKTITTSHARVRLPDFILLSTRLMIAVEVAVCESEIQMAQKCGGWKQQRHQHSYWGKKRRCGLKGPVRLTDACSFRD